MPPQLIRTAVELELPEGAVIVDDVDETQCVLGRVCTGPTKRPLWDSRNYAPIGPHSPRTATSEPQRATGRKRLSAEGKKAHAAERQHPRHTGIKVGAAGAR